MNSDNEILKIENFVRRVLAKNFNQRLGSGTLRAVAKKIHVTCDFAKILRDSQMPRQVHRGYYEACFKEGYKVGMLGYRLADDRGGWSTEYEAGWHAGIAVWRRF